MSESIINNLLETMSIEDGANEFTLPESAYYDNLPESLTRESVDAVNNYNAEYVGYTAKAFLQKASEKMEGTEGAVEYTLAAELPGGSVRGGLNRDADGNTVARIGERAINEDLRDIVGQWTKSAASE